MPSAFDIAREDLCEEECRVNVSLNEDSEAPFFDLHHDEFEVDEFGFSNLQLDNAPAPLKFWKSQHKSSAKSVAVFDWDDTLLATTHIAAAGYRLGQPVPHNVSLKAALEKLDIAAQALLQLALDHCQRVYIITNAEKGWVELSSQSWLPGVASMLPQVTLISARTTYEPRHPNAPLLWKWRAFQECTKHYDAKNRDDFTILHLLSFGDSNVEREAARNVASSRANTKVKTIKFVEQPTPETLRQQLVVMASRFSSLLAYENDLDLILPGSNLSSL
jgi:hypothetical protein